MVIRVASWPAYRFGAANPYTPLFCRALERHGATVSEFSAGAAFRERFDVLLVHWPDAQLNRKSLVSAFGRATVLLALLAVVRTRGCRIMWVMHNLHSHEHRFPRFERLFWACFLRSLDGCVSLTAAGRDQARKLHPRLQRLPILIARHGHFRSAYAPAPAKEVARARLGLPLEGRVVLYFGQVRRYKNVPGLLEALPPDETLTVLVVGKADDPSLRAELEARAQQDPRIRLDLRFVADEEVPTLFAAADLVVLPFSAVLNSSSAILALTFGRPVVVPDTGPFRELRSMVGEGWVRTFEGELQQQDVARALEAPPPGAPVLDQLDWDLIGRECVAALGALTAGPGRFTERAEVEASA